LIKTNKSYKNAFIIMSFINIHLIPLLASESKNGVLEGRWGRLAPRSPHPISSANKMTMFGFVGSPLIKFANKISDQTRESLLIMTNKSN